MPIRLIALDMDGTLMDSSHVRVSRRNREAIARCLQQGVEIVLSSGRPMSMLRDVGLELGARYAISSNGGAVWDLGENREIADRAIPPERAGAVMAVLLRHHIPLEVYCDGRIHVDASWRLDGYGKLPREFLEQRTARNVVDPDLAQAMAGKKVEKFNADNVPRPVFDAIMADLADYREGLAVNYIACYDNIEISRADATKGSALADLCRTLGLEAGEVMALGDSDNDVSMLAWAGLSVAMGNSEPAALAAARYRTGTNEDSGVAQALERYVLGDPI